MYRRPQGRCLSASCVIAQQGCNIKWLQRSGWCVAAGTYLVALLPLFGCQIAFWHVLRVPNVMGTCCPASLPAAKAVQRVQAVHPLGKFGVAARAHFDT